MRLLLFLAVLLFSCSSSDTGDVERDTPPFEVESVLLVANKSDNTLSFVDSATYKVLATTTTGTGPHEVAATPDGRWAFVANYEGPGDSISLIDITQQEEVRRISIDPYRQPHGIQVSADGTKVYATVEGSRAVIELDIATETINRVFETGQNVTHMLVLTPDNRKLYTANIGSGNATAIDLTSGEVVKQISTGAGAEGIDVTPDGSEIWVTNRAADTVSIIDSATDVVVANLPATGFPIRVKITPDGQRALVSCATEGNLKVYDVNTRELVDIIDTGAVPVGVLVEPGGGRAFIANTQANSVAVLDLSKMEVTDRITAGQTPDGLAFIK